MAPPPLAGDYLVASDVGDIAADSSTKPVGRVIQSATQNLTDNTYVAITFTAAVDSIDTDNAHDPTTNPSRITPPKPGFYRFTGTVWYNTATTAVRTSVQFRKNGSANLPPAVEDWFNGLRHGGPQVSMITDMNGTDYVELMALQDSSATITTYASGAAASVLEWEFLRDL
jgi:hypothetical protein